MSASSALLGLLRLASPALPVGGFSYSDALEAAVDASLVQDAPTAQGWLAEQLTLSLTRGDLPLVHHAWQAWASADFETVGHCNTWFFSTRETHEFRLQTQQMGRSLCEWMHQLNLAPDSHRRALLELQPAPCWPVAFALAAWQTRATAREGLLAYAFSWAENAVAAAIKSVPLGQTAGQRILAHLAERIEQGVERALQCPWPDLQSFTPGLAILSSRHETQYSRLFRS